MRQGWLVGVRPAQAEGQPFSVIEKGEGFQVRLGDQEIDLDPAGGDGLVGWCLWAGRLLPFSVAQEGKQVHVWVDGQPFLFGVQDGPPPRGRAAAEHAAGLTALVPGRVVEVLVHEGEHVQAGQRLAIIESMKMEFVVRSPGQGLVRRVRVEPGEQVVAGTPLLDVEPATR